MAAATAAPSRRRPVLDAWHAVFCRLMTIWDVIKRAGRLARRADYLAWRCPTLTSHLRALEAPLAATIPATYPVLRARGQAAVAFPSDTLTCDHPPNSAYVHGNQTGSYRECRECGARARGREWTNPINGEVVQVYDQELQARPWPGASVPRATRATKGSATVGATSLASAARPAATSHRRTAQPTPLEAYYLSEEEDDGMSAASDRHP